MFKSTPPNQPPVDLVVSRFVMMNLSHKNKAMEARGKSYSRNGVIHQPTQSNPYLNEPNLIGF